MRKTYTGLYGYMGAKGTDAMTYVELFKHYDEEGNKIERLVDTNFGAGNIVSAAAGEYKTRISNDWDEEIAFLADMVSRPQDREAVIKEVFNMDISKEVFDATRKSIEIFKFKVNGRKYFKEGIDYTDRVKIAAGIWYSFFNSFNGQREDFKKDRLLGKHPLIGRLEQLDTFDNAEIKNMDMVALLEEEKQHKELLEKTMYYLDPPYIGNKAGYKLNSETVKFHLRLLEVMADIPYVMISGYESDLYDEVLCGEYGYHKYHMREKAISMGFNKQREIKEKKTEVIWTSYPLIGPYQQ